GPPQPRRSCRDVSDHADTQVHGIRPRHSLPPSPNQRGQTRSLTSAWESLRFNPSGICSKDPLAAAGGRLREARWVLAGGFFVTRSNFVTTPVSSSNWQ